MSLWWLPLGVVVVVGRGEAWLPQTTKVYSEQIHCKWQNFRTVICCKLPMLPQATVDFSVRGLKICLCEVSVWSFLTCISGLATSSMMFLHSSLESAAIASSLSCTSWPLIWRWQTNMITTLRCKQTCILYMYKNIQTQAYTVCTHIQWGQLYPLQYKSP